MNPDSAPQFANVPQGEVVIAQLTIRGIAQSTAMIGAQGQSGNEYDWRTQNIPFVMTPTGGAGGGGHRRLERER